MRGLRRTDLSRRTSRFMPAGASRPRGGPRAEACNFRATEPAHEGGSEGHRDRRKARIGGALEPSHALPCRRFIALRSQRSQVRILPRVLIPRPHASGFSADKPVMSVRSYPRTLARAPPVPPGDGAGPKARLRGPASSTRSTPAGRPVPRPPRTHGSRRTRRGRAGHPARQTRSSPASWGQSPPPATGGQRYCDLPSVSTMSPEVTRQD